MNDLITSPSLFASNDNADVVAAGVACSMDFTLGEESARTSSSGPGRLNSPSRPKILIAAPLAHDAFLHGIGRYGRERNWQLMTDMLHSGVFPQKWDGDGILAYEPARSELSKRISAIQVPSVTVSMSDACQSLPQVQPDNSAIGVLAANHLLDRGCRDFVWAPYLDDSHNRKRLAGFLSVLRPLGHNCRVLPAPHACIDAGWSDDWENWRRAVRALFGELPTRAGIFAFNDCLSAELAAIAQAYGLSVPDDLAIIGVGNEPLDCDAAPVSLSSVDPNLKGLAYRAAELLGALLEGKRIASVISTVAPKGVISRESTAFSQSDNPRVTLAREFIATNYADPTLTVSSVAERIGVSRRQLEREFRNAKGYTAREYIENARMEEAARLLIAHAQAKISTIAGMVGILSTGNFFRIFRKRYGVTPAAYRESRARKDDQELVLRRPHP